MICHNCGATISHNNNFCTYCGARTLETLETSDYLAGTPLPSAPRSLDLGKLLGDTFELYKQHFGTMCLIGVLFCGIPLIFYLCGVAFIVAGMIAMVAAGGPAVPTPLATLFLGLYFLMIICIILSQLYITLGAIRQCLYVARGGVGFRADLMFPPVIMFLKFFGLMFIIGLVVYAFTLPGAIPFFVGLTMLDAHSVDNPFAVILIVIGIPLLVIGIILTIWVSVRWYLAYVFLADQNAGVIDSMRYSWRVTLGNFWILLLASIVLGICAGIGYFLCGVGLILTVAISWLGAALAYLQLTGQPNCLDYAAMQRQLDFSYPQEPETPTEPEA
ncbi:MAG: zinc-ribbon domain-containing protein [Planctomycetaceae bacterium]|nr:zinc-ribbon domain-containing protein [Planctomycetaceae bacterium]